MWASSNHPPIPTQRRRQGFTIVELLIVIVVIGILAAITIVAFNGVQKKAQASAAQSAVSQANKKVLAYAAQNSDNYPSSLAEAGMETVGSSTYQYSVDNTASPRKFCITATNATSDYWLSSAMTTPSSGACVGHGTGGAAPITNIAINPSAENGLVGVNPSGAAGFTIATDWQLSGASSFKMTPNAATNDTYFTLGGDLGGFRAGLEAGKTYTISSTVRLSAALAGTFTTNGSRQITAWYTNAAGGHTSTKSNQAANVAGQSLVSVTYSIPSDATGAWLRFYHGGSTGSGSLWFDNIMITEGSTTYAYADGGTSGWVWNGTPNASTSTGPRQ